MKPSKLLRLAAQYGENSGPFGSNGGMCGWLITAGWYTGRSIITRNRAKAIIEGLYLPEGKSIHTYWFGKLNAKNHEARIVALCLAADIAEEHGE